MTVKNKYLLPLIPELIAKLRRAKDFTKVDVRGPAGLQQRLDKGRRQVEGHLPDQLQLV